jgi:hypothetical protein
MGLAAGGMSGGQLVVIPLASWLVLEHGWRFSALWLGLGLLVLVLPFAAWLVRNTPEERGVRPVGASGTVLTAAQAEAEQRAGRVSISEAAQTLPFWLLMGTFFVCGYTSVGLIGTHFIPHALEHNFTAMQASTALGVMGALNIVGTIGSGWLCDRVGRRVPLAIFYFVRGLSLLFLIYVWNVPSLHFWAALFGLNYISTVPPTTTLTANIYGRFSVGELSGWIYFRAGGLGVRMDRLLRPRLRLGGGDGLPRGDDGADDPRAPRQRAPAAARARDDLKHRPRARGGSPVGARDSPVLSARSTVPRGAGRRRPSGCRPARPSPRRRRRRAIPTRATR